MRPTIIIDRVLRNIIRIPEAGCWIWEGKTQSNGYGVLRTKGRTGKYSYVHRVSYEHYKGPIPQGLQIDHLCRVRCCCNPSHMEAVTQRENMLRGEHPNLRAARTGLCAKGHPLKRRPSGKQQCYTCTNEWKRKNRKSRRKV